MIAERQGGAGPLAQSGVLTAAVAALWAVLALPAYRVSGPVGLQGLFLAAALCLVPGWLVFWVASRYRVAQSAAAAVMAGGVLRMLFVLFGVLAVGELLPALGDWQFLLWVVPFYLVTLVVETWLLLRRLPS